MARAQQHDRRAAGCGGGPWPCCWSHASQLPCWAAPCCSELLSTSRLCRHGYDPCPHCDRPPLLPRPGVACAPHVAQPPEPMVTCATGGPLQEHDYTPVKFQIDFESLKLRAADGTRLHAWLLKRPIVSSGSPTVLFCHGNAGNISHRCASEPRLCSYYLLLPRRNRCPPPQLALCEKPSRSRFQRAALRLPRCLHPDSQPAVASAAIS